MFAVIIYDFVISVRVYANFANAYSFIHFIIISAIVTLNLDQIETKQSHDLLLYSAG